MSFIDDIFVKRFVQEPLQDGYNDCKKYKLQETQALDGQDQVLQIVHLSSKRKMFIVKLDYSIKGDGDDVLTYLFDHAKTKLAKMADYAIFYYESS